MGQKKPVGFLSRINYWWQRWRAIFWGIAFLGYATPLTEKIFPFLPENPEINVRILMPLIAAWGILGGIAVKSCWDNRNFLDPKPIDTLYAGGNLSWSRMEYPKSLLEAMPIKEVSKEEARRLMEKMEFNPAYLYADQVQLQPDEIGCDGDNRYTRGFSKKCPNQNP